MADLNEVHVQRRYSRPMGLVWTPNSSAPACWAIGWGDGADQLWVGVAISLSVPDQRGRRGCRRGRRHAVLLLLLPRGDDAGSVAWQLSFGRGIEGGGVVVSRRKERYGGPEVGIRDRSNYGRGGREGRVGGGCGAVGRGRWVGWGFERLGSHCLQRVPGRASRVVGGSTHGDVQIGCRKPQTRLPRARAPNRGKRLGRMSKRTRSFKISHQLHLVEDEEQLLARFVLFVQEASRQQN